MRLSPGLLGLSLALLLSTRSDVRADMIYAFDKDTYTVAPGGYITVRLFLREAGSDVLATDGLYSAAGRIDLIGTIPSEPAQVPGLGFFEPNTAAGFDGGSHFFRAPDLPPGSVGFSLDVDPSSPPVMSTGDLLLASFTYQAGSMAGEVTRLRASDLFQSPSDDTISGQGIVLDDSLGTAEARIVVTEVPEPGSLCLLALGTCLVAFRFARSSKRNLFPA